MNKQINKQSSILSWVGGKQKIAPLIHDKIKNYNNKKIGQFAELFVGGAGLSFNIQADEYLWCDLNIDLINLYQQIKTEKRHFINEAKYIFIKENYTKEKYLEFREKFNSIQENNLEKAILFLYLNKNGFNGLCRYNSQGKYNVPFGSTNKDGYRKTYFPEQEIHYFLSFADRVTLLNSDFEKAKQHIKENINNKTLNIVYCDPPYMDYNTSATNTTFRKYNATGFGHEDQVRLMKMGLQLNETHKSMVIISNHYTDETQQLYKDYDIHQFDIKRMIAADKNKRNSVRELLAIKY